jgi:predicted enzyme related to lactoylglutathione lyase
MQPSLKVAAVLFAADPQRLAAFYAAMTGLAVGTGDEGQPTLVSDAFELTFHALAGQSPPDVCASAREDGHVRLVFPVASLAAARDSAPALGGRVRPTNEESRGRDFVACDAVDPEGNVIQLRESAA